MKRPSKLLAVVAVVLAVVVGFWRTRAGRGPASPLVRTRAAVPIPPELRNLRGVAHLQEEEYHQNRAHRRGEHDAEEDEDAPRDPAPKAGNR
jgi:hypothetical protein